MPRVFGGYSHESSVPLEAHLPALAFSTILAVRGYRSTSLSTSGATAALVFGYVTLANRLRLFAICLVGFYLAGSKATKVKSQIKATFEEPEHGDPPSARPAGLTSSDTSEATGAIKGRNRKGADGGRRTATQVACNALVGSVCAILWRILYTGEFLDPSHQYKVWDQGERWCVIERYPANDARRWSRVLVFAAIAFWSACCGDTFASELGILANQSPILITKPFSGPVPRGTNGGITLWGLTVSALGGIYVGVLAVACLLAQGQSQACQERPSWMVEMIVVAGTSGLGGSILDSLLGALFQPTNYSSTRRLVVHSAERKAEDKIFRVQGTAIFGPWLVK